MPRTFSYKKSLQRYPLVYFWGKYPTSTHRLGQIQQISCLICLPDKSGNFLAFREKTAQNTVKPENTGFGMAITARLRRFFCIFRPKIPRTFYFKLTEQSSRKKLAVGGFEPKRSTYVPCSTKESSSMIIFGLLQSHAATYSFFFL